MSVQLWANAVSVPEHDHGQELQIRHGEMSRLQTRTGAALLLLAASLGASGEALRELPLLAVPFVIGVTAHTTSILLLDEETSTAGLSLSAQLKTTTLLWCNIRRLEPCGSRPTTGATLGCQRRISFGLGRISRTLVFWLVDWSISEILLLRTLRSLPLGIHSFAPDKRTVLPSPWTSPGLAYSDYVLRAITSTHWIWITYCGLTTMHHLSAALFVSVLNWESPSNWAGPPLFGSIWDAYTDTLRRFWGVFWHRLHVVPFSAYTPPLPKALRALWVFLLSAAGHALVNWVIILGSPDSTMAEPRDSTETSLPPYDAVSQPYQEVCPPTTLVIVGQSIHALTADSPVLYHLSLGISNLSDITTEVELSRVEPKQDGSGRQRHIYDLRYMRSGPGGYVKLPSDSPHYFIERASRRVPGLQDLGLKKSRLPGKACTTVLPVDIRGKTSKYSIPNFVKDSAPVFSINKNRWADAQGALIASMHNTTERSLVVTAALPRAQFDMLVALWCCKWDQEERLGRFELA
ncbi:toxin biosynthesis protein, partial [Colletotrichum incanum]